MATSVKHPMLNLPKKIPVQLLLYKMATCLMRPATTFFDSQLKNETCLKQQQNFIQQRNVKKHKEQCIKNKQVSDYIYSIANS